LGQICQSYDVINIFSKWEATIPIRLFDKAYFSGLEKSSLSRGYKKMSNLIIIKNERNLILIIFKAEYSLRESVSAQGREGRGFDPDPGRNLK
jgi:hypothetical protein